MIQIFDQQVTASGKKTTVTIQKTDSSIESVTNDLIRRFAVKIILVNNEKLLPVDNVCANLAIKYDMIYLSASCVIRDHVQNGTDWGKKLAASKKKREVVVDPKVKDDMGEFSPCHYDMKCLLALLAETIAEKRTNQKFVLLEGCSTHCLWLMIWTSWR